MHDDPDWGEFDPRQSKRPGELCRVPEKAP